MRSPIRVKVGRRPSDDPRVRPRPSGPRTPTPAGGAPVTRTARRTTRAALVTVTAAAVLGATLGLAPAADAGATRTRSCPRKPATWSVAGCRTGRLTRRSRPSRQRGPLQRHRRLLALRHRRQHHHRPALRQQQGRDRAGRPRQGRADDRGGHRRDPRAHHGRDPGQPHVACRPRQGARRARRGERLRRHRPRLREVRVLRRLVDLGRHPAELGRLRQAAVRRAARQGADA